MKHLTILLFFALINFIANAQTKVPYLKKNGKYIYVDSATMKPVSNIEYDEVPKILINNGTELDLLNLVHSKDENDFDKNIIQFEKEGWWGYKDNNDVVLIKPIYTFTTNFSEGLAYVKNDEFEGIIDKSGKVVIKGVTLRSDFHNGLAVVDINDKSENSIYNDGCKEHTITCVIDKKGTRLLYLLNPPCKGEEGQIDTTKIDYTKIKPKGKYVVFKGCFIGGSAGSFSSYSEGLIGVKLYNVHAGEEFVSYVDLNGKIIIPPFKAGQPQPFTKGFSFNEELRSVGKSENWVYRTYYIDKKGRKYIEK